MSTITVAVTQQTLTLPSVTPDSQKSTTDKIGENVSGAGDRIAGAVQPGPYPSSPDLVPTYANNSQRARSLPARRLATPSVAAPMTPPSRARVSSSRLRTASATLPTPSPMLLVATSSRLPSGSSVTILPVP